MELACRVAVQSSVRRDQVGFQAHQLAPVQAVERGPGDIDDLALALKGRDARRRVVASLVPPVPGAADPPRRERRRSLMPM